MDMGVGDGLEAPVVTLVIDLTGLGMTSDNVGIDNVVFAQIVPEPRALLLLSGAALLGAWRRHRHPDRR